MLPFLCLAALLTVPACIDESLREGSDRNSQTDDDKDDDIDNPGVVRVVKDPETALATANCIMVRPGERVSIPIAKAFAVWDRYKNLLGKADMTGDMTPTLVWSIPDEMIDWDGLEIEDYDDVNMAVITFKTTPGMKGNAVVALTVGGTIRWSWHIWVTDYDPGKEVQPEALAIGPNDVTNGRVYRYINGAGDNVFMDRNLGANEADKTKGKETYGMYYQWGRKDPLFESANPNWIPEGPWEKPDTYAKTNLAYAIAHPDELIVREPASGDWYSYNDGVHDTDIWGSFSRKKTVWDPCPEGWKVPLYGLPRITYKNPSLSERDYSDQEKAPWHITEPGNKFIRDMTYIGFESPALGFWPATGQIDPLTGNKFSPGQLFSWSGSEGMTNFFDYSAPLRGDVYLQNDDGVWYNNGWSRATGMGVRCVRMTKGTN